MTLGSGLDARELLSTPDLIEVGAQGDDVRRRLHGARTTFVRVLEVHVDAVPSVLPQGASAGEIRIVGRPKGRAAATRAVNAAVALAAGRVPVTGFALDDLTALAPSESDFRAVARELRQLGLVAIADTPLDVFLNDAGAEAFVRIAAEEGLPARRLTVHAQPAAAAADMDVRIALVERAQKLGLDPGGFTAFAPLPRTMSITTPTTGYADVRQIALARVVVTSIPSIQVDWPLYGPKLAQVALTVGADDVDGVAAVDAGALGTRRSPLEEIRNNIRAAALEPVERDGNFLPLSECQ